jgi:hypothetical protein
MKRTWLVLLVTSAFGLADSRAASPKKLLLLGQGPDGHPPQTHEYMAGHKILQAHLRKVPGLEVSLVRADEPWREGPELLAKADGVVLFLSEGARWLHQNPRRLAAFRELAKRKGALVGLHWAIGTKEAKNIEGFVKLFGGCHGGPDRKYKVLTNAEVRVAEVKHPITFGIQPFRVRDEFYYHLKFAKPADTIRPVLQVPIDDGLETVAWSWERPDGGRSFGFSGLHFHENWSLPEYRRLVLQGVLWSLRLPIPAE